MDVYFLNELETNTATKNFCIVSEFSWWLVRFKYNVRRFKSEYHGRNPSLN